MAMVECKDCFRRADARCFQRCICCGAQICDDCASRNFGLCGDCSAIDN